jgi:hypothetical protein
MAQILSDYMETLFLALARKVDTKLGTNVKKPAHCDPCSNLRLSLKFFFDKILLNINAHKSYVRHYLTLKFICLFLIHFFRNVGGDICNISFTISYLQHCVLDIFVFSDEQCLANN